MTAHSTVTWRERLITKLLRHFVVRKREVDYLTSRGLSQSTIDILKREVIRYVGPLVALYSVAISLSFVTFGILTRERRSVVSIDDPIFDAFLEAAVALIINMPIALGWLVVAASVHMAIRLSGIWEPRRVMFLITESMSELLRCEVRRTPDEPLSGWRAERRKRRDARQRLISGAWSITGGLSVMVGRSRRERDWPPVTYLGQWLQLAADDVDDKSRRDGALQACADVLTHILGPCPWTVPVVVIRTSTEIALTPPRELPRRTVRVTAIRAGLLLVIPLVTVVVDLLSKLK